MLELLSRYYSMIDRTMVVLALLIYIWAVYGSQKDENVFFKVIVRKMSFYLDSISFMILSKDNKGVGPKKNPDPEMILAKVQAGEVKKKRIIFIRHGESDWNNVFNKGFNASFPFRLLSAMFRELRLFTSADSVFLDSPLNMEGIEQAVELSKFIQNSEGHNDEVEKLMGVLSGKDRTTTSIIVSSSLRRAIATTTIALWPRVEATKEKIHILSSLQEISRNVDTYALAPSNSVPDLPFDRVAPHCGGEKFNPTDVYETTDNHGQKTHSFYGQKRFKSFNDWAFSREEDLIIVGGHSLWFKYYFQTFLPHATDHDAKNKKITNSGAVSFTIHAADGMLADGSTQYRVDPSTVQCIYGGFTLK
jgi:hypothetical protein